MPQWLRQLITKLFVGQPQLHWACQLLKRPNTVSPGDPPNCTRDPGRDPGKKNNRLLRSCCVHDFFHCHLQQPPHHYPLPMYQEHLLHPPLEHLLHHPLELLLHPCLEHLLYHPLEHLLLPPLVHPVHPPLHQGAACHQNCQLFLPGKTWRKPNLQDNWAGNLHKLLLLVSCSDNVVVIQKNSAWACHYNIKENLSTCIGGSKQGAVHHIPAD